MKTLCLEPQHNSPPPQKKLKITTPPPPPPWGTPKISGFWENHKNENCYKLPEMVRKFVKMRFWKLNTWLIPHLCILLYQCWRCGKSPLITQYKKDNNGSPILIRGGPRKKDNFTLKGPTYYNGSHLFNKGLSWDIKTCDIFIIFLSPNSEGRSRKLHLLNRWTI